MGVRRRTFPAEPSPPPPRMYVDPGTGPLLTQLLLSAALGVGVGFRQKLRSLWRRIAGRGEDDIAAAAESPIDSDRQR